MEKKETTGSYQGCDDLKVMKRKRWLFLAVAAHGKGISGGDRIFIEFARQWARKDDIKIVVWEEGFDMCIRQKLKTTQRLEFELLRLKKWNVLGFGLSYLTRVLCSIHWALFTRQNKTDYLYSASEFWMDVFPAVILKIRNRQIKWIAAWYQTAPNPWNGFSYSGGQKRYRLKAFLYWFAQLPSKLLISVWADGVLVNNETEKKVFSSLKKKDRVIVVLGAVDTQRIGQFRKKTKVVKKYEAVFQGRFHPQKGVEELIDIWKLVCKKKPFAKLVLIGDGPLMKKVQLKVKINQLENNILLPGYLFDGDEKYNFFSQSKIVVHPALYDSGGMAAAEAMMFELPVVAFNLKAYDSYYPEGMLKVPFSKKKFAAGIIKLLDSPNLRRGLAEKGYNFLIRSASWQMRASQIYKQIAAL
jgi:glycosyltransferase involved in cell wall biosynthesis